MRNLEGKFMSTEDAFEIVYDMAQQYALDPATCSHELRGEALTQQTALNVVHDFLVHEDVPTEIHIRGGVVESIKGSLRHQIVIVDWDDLMAGYCPECGTDLAREDHDAGVCPECGLEF